jgi:hypothetical protein
MIVIPMAGLSRRFTDAGYRLPKYMLPLGGRTVFAHAIESFRTCFDTHKFLFVGRDLDGTHAFVEQSCRALGLRDAATVMLDAPTAGQAATVAQGLRRAAVGDDTEITIFNIDTFRPGFSFPTEPWWTDSDGYLEVFTGSGANWSYVRPSSAAPALVAETAEKRPISNLCCTGLYHFARAGSFHAALAKERAHPTAAELYVAPLYNHLIAGGQRIHYRLIASSDIVFCGVPAEYEALHARHDHPEENASCRSQTRVETQYRRS